MVESEEEGMKLEEEGMIQEAGEGTARLNGERDHERMKEKEERTEEAGE